MKVTVSKTCAKIENLEQLTSGLVGKVLDIEYSAEWSGLTVVAVFSNGSVTKDVLNPDNACVIPHEVLASPNKHATVGFYGYVVENGEKVLAIPTVYADLGRIALGADPSGDPSAELSATVAEQLQSELADHEQRIEYLEEHGGGGGESYDDTELRNRIGAIEGKESGWNAKYNKPSGGIPKTDLASDVKESLEKADTALQSHQSLAGYATEAYVQNYHDNTKQDVISDLATIRSGAALGATALQSVPNTYRTASAQDAIDNGKVDKVTGKGLSTNDYTNADKAKVDSAVQPEDLSDYAEKSDLEDYAKTEDVPTQLSELSGDSTHRVVTDVEKTAWNGKQNALTAGENISITNNVISAAGGGNVDDVQVNGVSVVGADKIARITATGGGVVATDTTLTHAGEPADAKAVGDVLNPLMKFVGEWTDGSFIDKTGAIINYAGYSYITIPVTLITATTINVRTKGVTNCGLCWYDETGSIIGKMAHPSDGVVNMQATVPSNTKTIRFSSQTSYKSDVQYDVSMPSNSLSVIMNTLDPKDKQVIRKYGNIEYENLIVWWDSNTVSDGSAWGFFGSELLEIPSGAKFTIVGYGEKSTFGSAGYGFFDEKGELLSSKPYTDKPQIDVMPEGARYLKFTTKNKGALVYYECDTAEYASAKNTYKGKFYGIEKFLNTCICIGDSTTHGQVSGEDYPTRFATMTDWNVTNAGVSGATSTSWYNNEISKYDFTNYQVAIINFGTNGGFTDTFASDVEAHESYEDYADTAVGNYCKIIETIKEQNPDIILFIAHPPKWITYGTKILNQIANKYGIMLIDLLSSKFTIRHNGMMADNLHPNKIGYFMMARAIYEGVCEYLSDNPSKILAVI